MLLLSLFTFGTLAVPAATVEWDGGGGNDSWHTAANWSPDRVLGANDDVVISPSAGTVVGFSAGLATVRSLQCASGLRLTWGRLTVTASSDPWGQPPN